MIFPPYVRHPALRPGDLVVALGIALNPGAGYAFLASRLIGSQSWVHTALKRLHLAGLADFRHRALRHEPFLDFLYIGLPRFASPIVGPMTPGVPTAWLPRTGGSSSGRIAPGEIGAFDARATPDDAKAGFVWPLAGGTSRGLALMPLRPNAHAFARRRSTMYRMLCLVDALRVRTSERDRAFELLAGLLAPRR